MEKLIPKSFQTEKNGVVYPLVKIIDITEISKKKVKEFEDYKFYLTTGNLDNSKILALKKVTYQSRPSRADLLVDIDDVIFAKMQSTKKNLLIDEDKRDLIVSTGFYILKPKQDKILPKYLFFIVESNFFQNQKDKFCVGATQKALNNEGLKNLKIPLPSLHIQQKIVERLDAIRKAQQLNEKQISLTNELFQSLLHQELKPRKGWKIIQLKEVIIELTNGFASRPVSKTKGISQIRPHNISNDGSITLDGIKFVPETIKNIEKYFLKKGDILFNNTNSIELVGKTAYVNQDYKIVFSNHITRIRTKENIVNSYFLSAFLNYIYFLGKFRSLCTPWVNQAGINNEILKNLQILIPPLETQHQIIEKLYAVRDYKRKLLEQKEFLQELFESTLNKAMKGELIK